ncbi:hypothetical protein [Chitinophaga vietnamensis]|uniref:hypothetical protein n=1 Tax=Chitinophaga vietnamensis TaxID=2593957 RepID=UPI001178AF12|nr:hypothetical protein [Chitinophaga vietnamensis]
MAKMFRGAWLFIRNTYLSAESAVIGNVLQHTQDTYEQAKIKLIFDYIFFYCSALLPVLFLAMLTQNEVNLIIIPFVYGMTGICLFLLKKGVSISIVGSLTSLTTLAMPILSSYFNNQDVSPKYAIIWMVSILLCYITVNLATALAWSLILCSYLAMVAYIKLNAIPVYVSPGYSNAFQYLSNPLVVAIYILFVIRALGQYYRNIISMEKRRTKEKQQQHLSLINQNLTKQFLLVKGFSRSGKAAFVNGELELLEACFTEIEKQCGSAIDFLNEAQED